jgi:Na+-translocating ferredoxin:NAD+ oxidoreductase RNF subunit RnfB
MTDLTELFAGIYQDGIYVSVDGGALKKVPRDLKIGELFEGRTLKGLELGHQLYGRDALSLTVEESNISNGVVHALTERDCVIKLVNERLLASRNQACGKCVFCREGLLQIQEMHKDITEGKGKKEYLEIIEEIGEAVCGGSLCSMGQQASQTALSARKHFYDEYEKHIKKNDCPAKVCFSLKSIYIDPNTCTGCEKCINICPKDAILGKKGYIHMIDALDCTQCGVCVDICEEGSIVITEEKPPKLPDRLIKCGRFKK